MPKLVELHGSLEGKWEPDSTSAELLDDLLGNFNPDSYYFADTTPLGDLVYFAALVRQTEDKALFWLFYMNKDFREQTKFLLEQMKTFMKGQGFSTVYTQSTRLASSYERWLEKFGAEKIAIVYKFNL